MKLIRVAGIAASLCVSLILTGCGDVYRPVVNPFTQPGGDPQTSRTALVLNQGVIQPFQPPASGVVGSVCDTAPCPGSSTHIDMPGDTNTGNHELGRSPFHLLSSSTQVWVANRDDNNVSTYSTTSGSPITISLPTGSAPVFVASTESGSIYVAMPGPDPTAPGNVGVISLATSALAQTIPVGKNPTAMVETPDQKKLYVLNKGEGTVTVVATLDKKILGTIKVGGGGAGSAPVWAIATPDSKFVFVLNRGSKTVSLLSTSNDASEIGEVTVGASADLTDISGRPMPQSAPMSYDSRLQRLYVTNSIDGTLSVFDASALPSLPSQMPGSPVVLGNPSPNPVSVAPLSDGSRVYVANSTAGTVSIVDARSLTLKKTLPVGTNTVGLAADSDGLKVMAVNHDPTVQLLTAGSGSKVPVTTQQPGTVAIQTSDDSIAAYIPAPFQDPVNCVADTPQPWIPGMSYSVGMQVVPSTDNGHAFRASTAGKSGSTEPAWCTTAGCTVTDGSVTWTENGAPKNCPRQQPWFISSF